MLLVGIFFVFTFGTQALGFPIKEPQHFMLPKPGAGEGFGPKYAILPNGPAPVQPALPSPILWPVDTPHVINKSGPEIEAEGDNSDLKNSTESDSKDLTQQSAMMTKLSQNMLINLGVTIFSAISAVTNIILLFCCFVRKPKTPTTVPVEKISEKKQKVAGTDEMVETDPVETKDEGIQTDPEPQAAKQSPPPPKLVTPIANDVDVDFDEFAIQRIPAAPVVTALSILTDITRRGHPDFQPSHLTPLDPHHDPPHHSVLIKPVTVTKAEVHKAPQSTEPDHEKATKISKEPEVKLPEDPKHTQPPHETKPDEKSAPAKVTPSHMEAIPETPAPIESRPMPTTETNVEKPTPTETKPETPMSRDSKAKATQQEQAGKMPEKPAHVEPPEPKGSEKPTPTPHLVNLALPSEIDFIPPPALQTEFESKPEPPEIIMPKKSVSEMRIESETPPPKPSSPPKSPVYPKTQAEIEQAFGLLKSMEEDDDSEQITQSHSHPKPKSGDKEGPKTLHSRRGLGHGPGHPISPALEGLGRRVMGRMTPPTPAGGDRGGRTSPQGPPPIPARGGGRLSTSHHHPVPGHPGRGRDRSPASE